MPAIGPTLPPHLTRGRRDDGSQSDSDSDSPGPRPPSASKSSKKPLAAPKSGPSIGPTLPPSLVDKAASQPRGESSAQAKRSTSPPSLKRKRIAGPTLPPAPLDQRPLEPPSSDSDSSDDDYGPSLPTAGAAGAASYDSEEDDALLKQSQTEAEDSNKLERAEWMTLPPSASAASLQFDPSKHRARAFNSKPTGLSGRSKGQDGPAAQWMESPEERQKRLANEVLGISSAASGTSASSASEKKRKLRAEEDAETARRLSSKRRGEDSLMDSHVKKNRKDGKDDDDDPSKRSFNWEKDMNAAASRGVGEKGRKDMVNKASSEFGGRFSGGGYL
jgi:Protein of unknown function (DUF3752)